MQPLRLFLAWVLIASSALGAERDARRPAPDAKPKVIRLSFVIAQLKEEAARARREKQWPRGESDLAQAMGWTLPRDQAVRALGTDLGLNASTEAYVKWQLLSFVDDFTSVDLEALTRIRMAQPQAGSSISRGCVPCRDFIRSQPLAPQRYLRQGSKLHRVDPPPIPPPQLPTAADLQQQMQAAGERMGFLSEPVRKYQQALAERIPETQALRLAVLMRTAENLVLKGDPRVAGTMAQLMSAARTGSEELTGAERRELIRFLSRLAAARGPGFSTKIIGRAIAITPPRPETLVAPDDLRELLEIFNAPDTVATPEPDTGTADPPP